MYPFLLGNDTGHREHLRHSPRALNCKTIYHTSAQCQPKGRTRERGSHPHQRRKIGRYNHTCPGNLWLCYEKQNLTNTISSLILRNPRKPTARGWDSEWRSQGILHGGWWFIIVQGNNQGLSSCQNSLLTIVKQWKEQLYVSSSFEALSAAYVWPCPCIKQRPHACPV